MTHTRRLWALLALVLTLVLAACSTPADLNAPTLEPQFGTRGFDDVEQVAYSKAGYLYVLVLGVGKRSITKQTSSCAVMTAQVTSCGRTTSMPTPPTSITSA
jgi:hypothetical protein